MTVDEALKQANEGSRFPMRWAEAAMILAAEVERLRAEVDRLCGIIRANTETILRKEQGDEQ